MKIRKGLWLAVTGSLVLSLGGAGASAQTQDKQAQDKAQSKSERHIIVEHERIEIAPEGAGMLPPPGEFHRVPGGDTFVFVSTEMSVNGKVVKGAPYSAEAVSEFTQTLADGNRIVRKNTATVYRDSEGRTRRDQNFTAIGPFASGGDTTQTFFINDPVAKVNYILDPRTRTARKLPSIPLRPPLPPQPKTDGAGKHVQPAPGDTHEFRLQVLQPPPPGAPPAGDARMMVEEGVRREGGRREVVPFERRELAAPQKESLGKRTIEGVEAEGTRLTHTIPAGEIGNEQPINIVTETWYSPELQTVVMSRHSDPRMGESIYRLTNINRSEPARSLFEIPSDYTVKETPAVRTMTFERRKNDRNEK